MNLAALGPSPPEVLRGIRRLHARVDRAAEGIRREEERLLAVRRARSEASVRWSQGCILVGGPVAFLVAALTLWSRVRLDRAVQEKNQRLQESISALERQHRQVSLMGEAANLLQAAASVEEAFQIGSQLLGQLLGRYAGACYVFKESRNLLDLVARWGTTGRRKSCSGPEQCWALRLGKPYGTEGGQALLGCSHVGAGDTVESLCLPLVAQGETLGVLHLTVPRPGLIDPESRRLAGSLAEILALALANLRLRETLRSQSIRDPLTGLFNRRFMEESLERELGRAERNCEPVSVVMLDLDHFKKFNDTHGHAAGDRLLQHFGRFLKGSLRRQDVACRYGGEEFVLILSGAAAADAQARLDQLRQALGANSGDHMALPCAVTFSAGVAGYPAHGQSAQELLHAADTALYQAKQSGRDRVTLAGWPSPAGDRPIPALGRGGVGRSGSAVLQERGTERSRGNSPAGRQTDRRSWPGGRCRRPSIR